MSCGCGGGCCGQPKGLGFLWWGGGESGGGSGDYWGFDDPFWSDGGGWDSPGGWWDVSGGGYGLDFWGLDDASYWDYFGYTVGPAYTPGPGTSFNVDFGFLPSSPGVNTSGSNSGFWDGVQRAIDALTGGGGNPPLLPYCPGGTYHPQDNPYSCVPFPPETPEFEKQQRAAAAHKAAQDALKAQQRAQQQQQGCPPNTGLVKNAQGQCVCPPGYAPNAQLKKCVLVNASLAAQANQAPDWLKWAILAGVVVLVVKHK